MSKCGDKFEDCKKNELSGCEASNVFCKDNCDTAKKDCLKDAKSAPTVPFKPKVQPKVTPGGAETPGTESPNIKPKGGIQQQP